MNYMSGLRAVVNNSLKGKDAFDVVVRTVFGVVAVFLIANVSTHAQEYKNILLRQFFKWVKKVPAVQKKIEEEMSKVLLGFKQGLETSGQKFLQIPEKGKPYEEVLAMMKECQQNDLAKSTLQFHSGCIYLGDDKHTEFTNAAYGMFSLSNPLHTDVFPNVRRFEAEVVSMTARMLNGGPSVCGAMTSGGTESILMAVKSYRDFAREHKGIKKPELVVPITVHSAFDKACAYFNIKIVHVGLTGEYKVDLSEVTRAITSNTIALVGSAPNFPHGMIDDIEGLAAIARAYNIGLHVDGCLGGFILPFISKSSKYEQDIPPFDFRVEGVTSMSADTHKYGYAPKGTSVVLFHSPELRKYMFFSAPDWTGGIYGSPTMPGSRPGGLIASAWATLVAIGEDGYSRLAGDIMEATRLMLEGIRSIPDLFVLGDPKAMVIAFSARKLNIYKISAAMEKRGWHLSSLQRPAAVHICVTARHIGNGPKFARDLRSAVEEVVNNPSMYNTSSAAMYGSAASLPDRTLVHDTIVGVLNTMLDA